MRLEITKRTDLAVRALHELARHEAGVPCRGVDLAAALDTTTNYLPQVMSPLHHASWVDSAPGPSGGYRLTTDLKDISLLDVIEAVEGPVDDSICVLTGAPCPDQGECAMHQPWSRARRSLLSELESTPIANVRSRAPEKERNHAS